MVNRNTCWYLLGMKEHHRLFCFGSTSTFITLSNLNSVIITRNNILNMLPMGKWQTKHPVYCSFFFALTKALLLISLDSWLLVCVMKTVCTVCCECVCVCAVAFLCVNACVCVCECVLMASPIKLCWGQHFLYACWKSQGFWLNKNLSREWKGLECLLMPSRPLDSCGLQCTCPYGAIISMDHLYCTYTVYCVYERDKTSIF